MIVKIDGFDIDISAISKKIVCKQVNEKYYVTYALNFPNYTDSKILNSEEEATKYIGDIKSDNDSIKYINN